MKNKILIISLIALFAIGCVVVIVFAVNRLLDTTQSDVGEFSVSEYEWEIENFSVDQNVGEVNDKNVAIKNAKSLWLEKYSIDIHEKKIEVAYDSKEECWHIYGTLSPNALGGVLHAIIQKEGDVLAVWIDD